jgi:hypothetical protein
MNAPADFETVWNKYHDNEQTIFISYNFKHFVQSSVQEPLHFLRFRLWLFPQYV